MTDNSPPLMLTPDAPGIAAAADLLRQGAVVAVPTETVYGLAARADRDDAVAAIYQAKGRPDFNPLIVHVATLDQARRLALFDDRAELLASTYWPGPLTLVLPRRKDSGIAAAVTAGLETIALRMPNHPAMQTLLAETGLPLAAPSANRSGAISPTSVQHVVASLGGRIAAVIDGGECAQGLESTIVAPRDNGEWHLLRPGPIAQEALERIMGQPAATANGAIEAPGQLASHYAPGKPMRLNVTEPEGDEYMIGFGLVTGHTSLSESGDMAQAAARLYTCLHLAAEAAQPRIAVAPVPESGIGVAMNDRLRRAAV